MEGIFSFFRDGYQREFNRRFNKLLDMSELDSEIKWKEGKFYPAGVRELDEALVNDSLKWLRENHHEAVLRPFDKALKYLLHANIKPELLADVISNAFEASEELAKIVTKKNRTLDKNRELFISRVKASSGFKGVLKSYCDFAHPYRPGVPEHEKKTEPSYHEAESFVYMTGLIIRLVISSGFDASSQG